VTQMRLPNAHYCSPGPAMSACGFVDEYPELDAVKDEVDLLSVICDRDGCR